MIKKGFTVCGIRKQNKDAICGFGRVANANGHKWFDIRKTYTLG